MSKFRDLSVEFFDVIESSKNSMNLSKLKIENGLLEVINIVLFLKVFSNSNSFNLIIQ